MGKIEELEAKHEAAKKAILEAQTKMFQTKKDLEMAYLDDTGFLGHKVKNDQGIEFVVEKQGWWKGRVAGSMVKKDGTLGQRQVDAAADKITDLGIYEAPTK